ncbi:DUF3426 domain-containing protein [Ectothiorhodospira mobilis]|uniref:DUF3426 domain-containing protein n=1 Tax=Ectothiorhodospira mobilis TaxID=195064 RepID=UPI001EE8C192|nr:DUF3426 domain-containing protein [Ectothiorhodospira mobilis]MCG5535477.1 DUF3426 domain-containing protein [Ectothiorhodospira mobilis]
MDPATAPHRDPTHLPARDENLPKEAAPPPPAGPPHDAPLPRALREALEAPPSRPGTGATLAWGLACLALILLLAGQILYHERHRLLAIPALEPGVRALCRPLPCALPPPRDLAALRLTQRRIRALPERPGILEVTAVVENTAAFPQPAPVIELTLRDLQGRPVAARRFFPADYRPGEASGQPLAPGESFSLALAVQDPGAHAPAFEFRFLPGPHGGGRL